MTPLLVLIDLQQDFLCHTELTPSSEGIVHNARCLLDACRIHGIPVVHVWTTLDRRRDERMKHWKDAGRWLCEEGTPGHATPAVLAPRDGEVIVHKTGFSGFYGTNLYNAVLESAADTLVVCGIHLHACIRQTVLDAYQSGWRVVVAEDAVGSHDALHATLTRQYLEDRSVPFRPAKALALSLSTGVCPYHAATPRASTGSAVDGAVDNAAAFRRRWRHTDQLARAELVGRLADAVSGREDELARLMAHDIGKPLRFGRLEIRGCAEMLRAVAARRHDETCRNTSDRPVSIRRRPHGVVAIISPWNNPVYIPLGKIAPAVMYGNTVVWKPAPEARRVSERIADLMAASGWPEQLVQRVEGGREAGEAVLNAPSVAAISITGSSQAGYAAQAIGARRRVPVQAELGGNNCAIVVPDADIEDAVRQIAAGAFDQAGQRCTANSRLIVHAECRASVLDLLVKETQVMTWGDPTDENTRVGPMVTTQHRDRVSGMVDRAIEKGAEVIWPLGKGPPAGSFDGAWYPPVILCCDDSSLEIVQEEIFGPVLRVQTSRDWSESIALCNGVRQGLASSVFTRSKDLIHEFLDSAEAGILKVNQSTASAAVDAPFGGWKNSGVGPPEHGAFDREFYTRPQTVYRRG